jgi:hypothetical protein
MRGHYRHRRRKSIRRRRRRNSLTLIALPSLLIVRQGAVRNRDDFLRLYHSEGTSNTKRGRELERSDPPSSSAKRKNDTKVRVVLNTYRCR